jgi:GH15 family glucan-1,4-alpha-glucosidase
MSSSDRFQPDVAIILESQTPSGAYLASPNFPTYHYCWFRDGAYIAYAMGIAGEHESAARFHAWAAAAVNARAGAIDRAIAAGRRGEIPSPADQLHTRYTADGEVGDDDWPNFQLDGLGTWLWALREHEQLSGSPVAPEWRTAAGRAADYLAALWQLPCYDCWEEFPDLVHPYTLAAIHGGLIAAEQLTGRPTAATRDVIRTFLLAEGVRNGRFVKAIGVDSVDASLLGLAVPFRIVEPDHPAMVRTVEEIQATLCAGGGVHRYAADTYFGGGQWVLLTAWLGWYLVEAGRRDEALPLLAWVEAQATTEGWLPEQVAEALNEPAYYEPWRNRWGDIACPLLWSHAKAIILRAALNGAAI